MKTLTPRTWLLIATGLVALAVIIRWPGSEAVKLDEKDPAPGQAARQLALLVHEVRALFPAGGGYVHQGSGLLSPVLAQGPALPAEMKDGAGGLRHPWGGRVDVQGQPGGFAITLRRVPEAGCISLAGSAGLAPAPGIKSITIGGHAVVPPLSLADSWAFCKGNADMSWSFR